MKNDSLNGEDKMLVKTLENCPDCNEIKRWYPEEICDRHGIEKLKAEIDLLHKTLSLAHEVLDTILYAAPGYDWNSDPLFLTAKAGEVFAQAVAAKKRKKELE